MPLSRQQKESLSDAYEKGVASAPHIFLLDYKGITVPQDTELRSSIRSSQCCRASCNFVFNSRSRSLGFGFSLSFGQFQAGRPYFGLQCRNLIRCFGYRHSRTLNRILVSRFSRLCRFFLYWHIFLSSF